MLDGFGDNDDGEGVESTLEGLDVVDIDVGQSLHRALSVITPDMINKAVQHVMTAKAQRQYLRDSVTAAS